MPWFAGACVTIDTTQVAYKACFKIKRKDLVLANGGGNLFAAEIEAIYFFRLA